MGGRSAGSHCHDTVADTEEYWRHLPPLSGPQWRTSANFAQNIAKMAHLDTIGGDDTVIDTVTYFPTLSDQSRPMPKPQLGQPNPGGVHTDAPPPVRD
ncbi:hypothetical protein [Paraburkholderia atlantica]|uniref:hypothetical protein n=1 Tax=Paraburkholderia atlantica TaxID=2654982 RepID=UPI0012FF1396|nr:hypothetical protein [Paraburkholderia atlantica]